MTSKFTSTQIPDKSNGLLPTLIYEKARSDPDKIFCALLKSANVEDGLTMVTYGDYANAINRCAWWLENELGKGENFETLAYLGPSDIRYNIIAFAASKINYKTMLVAPQNLLAGHLSLLDATKCNIFITPRDSSNFDQLVSLLSSNRTLQVHRIESIEYLLNKEKVPEYPFHGSLEKDSDQPFVVVHTSGSTGLPKPIVYTFGALASYHTWLGPEKLIPGSRPNAVAKWQNNFIYSCFPQAGMPGFLLITVANIYWNLTPILGPGTVFPTPALISSIHQLELCQASFLPPSFLEALARTPEYLEGLRKLRFVLWGGSPFSSSAIASKINSHVPTYTIYGATEVGPLPLTFESQEYHDYMTFSPIVGAQFRHHSDDLYEFVIVKDPSLRESQKVFHVFPELTEWHSKDLMSKHPTKEGMWRYRGRKDDILVLLNGHNIDPLPVEGIVAKHQKVVSALLIGTGRPHTALLIEATEPPRNLDETVLLINDIWPTIQEANAVLRLEGKISRDKIIFTSKEKPMLKAAKGTVQRPFTIEAYKSELDVLYK